MLDVWIFGLDKEGKEDKVPQIYSWLPWISLICGRMRATICRTGRPLPSFWSMPISVWFLGNPIQRDCLAYLRYFVWWCHVAETSCKGLVWLIKYDRNIWQQYSEFVSICFKFLTIHFGILFLINSFVMSLISKVVWCLPGLAEISAWQLPEQNAIQIRS